MSKIQTTKPLLVTLSTILFFNSVAFAGEKNTSSAGPFAEPKTCSTPFADPDKNAQLVALNKQQIADVLDSKEFFAEWSKLAFQAKKLETSDAITWSAQTLRPLSQSELNRLNEIALNLGLLSPVFLLNVVNTDFMDAIENKHYFFTPYQTQPMKQMIASSKLEKREFLLLIDSLDSLLSDIEQEHKISKNMVMKALLWPYTKEAMFIKNDISHHFKSREDWMAFRVPWYLDSVAILVAFLGSIFNLMSFQTGGSNDILTHTAAELALLFGWPSFVMGKAAIQTSQNSWNYVKAAKRTAALYKMRQAAMMAKTPIQKIGDTQKNYLDVPTEIKSLPGKGADSVFAESYTFRSLKNFLEESKLLMLPKMSTNYESVGKLALDLNILKAQSEYLVSIAESALTEASALGSRSCRADSLCIEHKAIINDVIKTQTNSANKTAVINDHINFAQIVLNDLISATAVLEGNIAQLENSVEIGQKELQKFQTAVNLKIADSALSALVEDIQLLKAEQIELSNSFAEVTAFIKAIKKLR